ncbi:MAG: flagellar basal body P-ring formation chaperone FlgA [Planctomycetota bacterium]|jgi:flagella basal body P-ring formation protein FlgA
MNRKDCDIWRKWNATEGTRRRTGPRTTTRSTIWLLLAPALCALHAADAEAAPVIQIWPTAVVDADQVRVDDVCDFSRYQGKVAKSLRESVICNAPDQGGSRIIHRALIRETLKANGVNLASTMVRGAVRCEVTRPAAAPTRPAVDLQAETNQATVASQSNDAPSAEVPDDATTLRSVIQSHLDGEFERYGGTAETRFDRDAHEFLEMTTPPYDFRIHRRSGSVPGLASLEIEVLAPSGTLQVIPVVVQVSLVRDVVVARRAINQDARVRPADVTRKTMSFTKLSKLGLDDPGLAIGQRARRFVQAGTIITANMLESVPLVLRGQLVNVVSQAGGVRIVTSGMAGSDGRLGEMVRVRSSNDRNIEFDGIVTGPGSVRIGGTTPASMILARTEIN